MLFAFLGTHARETVASASCQIREGHIKNMKKGLLGQIILVCLMEYTVSYWGL